MRIGVHSKMSCYDDKVDGKVWMDKAKDGKGLSLTHTLTKSNRSCFAKMALARSGWPYPLAMKLISSALPR